MKIRFFFKKTFLFLMFFSFLPLVSYAAPVPEITEKEANSLKQMLTEEFNGQIEMEGWDIAFSTEGEIDVSMEEGSYRVKIPPTKFSFSRTFYQKIDLEEPVQKTEHFFVSLDPVIMNYIPLGPNKWRVYGTQDQAKISFALQDTQKPFTIIAHDCTYKTELFLPSFFIIQSEGQCGNVEASREHEEQNFTLKLDGFGGAVHLIEEEPDLWTGTKHFYMKGLALEQAFSGADFMLKIGSVKTEQKIDRFNRKTALAFQEQMNNPKEVDLNKWFFTSFDKFWPPMNSAVMTLDFQHILFGREKNYHRIPAFNVRFSAQDLQSDPFDLQAGFSFKGPFWKEDLTERIVSENSLFPRNIDFTFKIGNFSGGRLLELFAQSGIKQVRDVQEQEEIQSTEEQVKKILQEIVFEIPDFRLKWPSSSLSLQASARHDPESKTGFLGNANLETLNFHKLEESAVENSTTEERSNLEDIFGLLRFFSKVSVDEERNLVSTIKLVHDKEGKTFLNGKGLEEWLETRKRRRASKNICGEAPCAQAP